jgi:hypothetical protein
MELLKSGLKKRMNLSEGTKLLFFKFYKDS